MVNMCVLHQLAQKQKCSESHKIMHALLPKVAIFNNLLLLYVLV